MTSATACAPTHHAPRTIFNFSSSHQERFKLFFIIYKLYIIKIYIHSHDALLAHYKKTKMVRGAWCAPLYDGQDNVFLKAISKTPNFSCFTPSVFCLPFVHFLILSFQRSTIFLSFHHFFIPAQRFSPSNFDLV